ncbi:MAG: site-2 protease family protein [Rhodocyclaceae bacterium]|nr:site-2 protease family protein [Rhodocyclaceae bacterium]MBX3666996.1 site-2 protease family protein [Rhodocyclaceae bacterium]
MDDTIARLALLVIPVVLAITLHEAAHGYAAKHFGDPTAWLAGRISANPLRHIDPVGTVAVPLVIYLLGSVAGHPGFLFGWAKPVPVDLNRLRHPKRDMLWVAAAGPAANLAMAIGWALLFDLGGLLGGSSFRAPLIQMSAEAIRINLLLCVLNLIPIPPLDGGRIAASLLPSDAARGFMRLEPYGVYIVIGLFMANVLDRVLFPMVDLLHRGIVTTFQIYP